MRYVLAFLLFWCLSFFLLSEVVLTDQEYQTLKNNSEKKSEIIESNEKQITSLEQQLTNQETLLTLSNETINYQEILNEKIKTSLIESRKETTTDKIINYVVGFIVGFVTLDVIYNVSNR